MKCNFTLQFKFIETTLLLDCGPWTTFYFAKNLFYFLYLRPLVFDHFQMTAPGVRWTSVPQDYTNDDTKALKKSLALTETS